MSFLCNFSSCSFPERFCETNWNHILLLKKLQVTLLSDVEPTATPLNVQSIDLVCSLFLLLTFPCSPVYCIQIQIVASKWLLNNSNCDEYPVQAISDAIVYVPTNRAEHFRRKLPVQRKGPKEINEGERERRRERWGEREGEEARNELR